MFSSVNARSAQREGGRGIDNNTAEVDIGHHGSDHAAAVARRTERLENLWGAEPIYETQPEDHQHVRCCGLCGSGSDDDDDGSGRDSVDDGDGRPVSRGMRCLSCLRRVPNIFSVCFFTWSGDTVFRAVREELELPELLGPTKEARAFTCGKALSCALNAQWGERHRWDALIGSRVTLRARRGNAANRDGTGVGFLCYVGPVASYSSMHDDPPEGRRSSSASSAASDRRRRNQQRQQWQKEGKSGTSNRLFAGVLWYSSPSTHAHDSVEVAREGPGVSLRHGHDAHTEAAALWLNDESLTRVLPPGSSVRHLLSTCRATYETVEEIRFLADAGPGASTTDTESSSLTDADVVKKAVPRPMSLLRALFTALGRHLWRLGYWRVLMEVTTLASPMVLRAYIRYLDRGGDGSAGSGTEDPAGEESSEGGGGNVTQAALSLLSLFVASDESASGAKDGGGGSGPFADAALNDWARGISVVLLFFLVAFVHNVAFHKYGQLCYRCFYTYRSAIGAVILEKALTMDVKSASLPGFHAGRIVNMLTNDVEQLEQMCILLWPTLVAPLQVGFAMYFIYKLVGWAVFAGFGVSLLFVPLQLLLTFKVYRCFTDLARATDARLKATNEFLGGVRVAKFMSWEPVFLAKIQAKRDAEMALVKRAQTLFTFLSFATDILPNVVTATLFASYSLSGHPLRPDVIFPTLSLTGLLCLPFRLLPMYANWMSSFFVSMQRITAFLECADSDDNETRRARLVPSLSAAALSSAPPPPTSSSRPPAPLKRGELEQRWHTYAVEFINATITAFAAEALPSSAGGSGGSADEGSTATPAQRETNQGGEGDESPGRLSGPRTQEVPCYMKPVHVLSGITLAIPRGKFTVIIGPTGSGKSSLLSCLLGALEVTQGSVLVRENDSSSIAFVPEKPWVMDASVQDNVLFFDALDPERMHATLAATQLMTDIPNLPDGVATRVGERGISLSGGQQARLSLARAVYASGKELYLMDDPLSALDPRVAQLVVEQCLLDMLKGKTRVLATHQTHVAQYADYVIVMAGGKVEFQGSYAAYRTYAKGSTYKGRRSDFVEFSGTMLPVTQPNSTVDLEALIDGGVGSPISAGHLLLPVQQHQQRQRGAQEDAPPHEAQHPSPLSEVHNAKDPFLAVASAVEPFGGGDGTVRSEAARAAPGLLSPTLAAASVSPSGSQGQSQQQQQQHRERGDGPESSTENETADRSSDVKPILSMADEEERARGAVPTSLYARFVKACGGRNALIAFLAVYALSEMMLVSSQLWLSYWSDHPTSPEGMPEEEVPANDSSSSSSASRGGSGSGGAPSAKALVSERISVYIYLACVLIGALGIPLRFLISFRFLRRGCRVFHDNLLLSVSRATFSFFDAVPHGRLLNRFARDVHLIDDQLVSVVIAFAMSVVYLTSSLLIMVGSQLMTLGFVIPFVIAFYKINVFNCAMVRALQRLDNVATAPVVSALTEFLSGRWTITAFRRSSEMLHGALQRIDVKFSSSYTIVVGQVWVGVRVQLLSAALLSAVAFMGVVSRHVPWVHINAGLISLTITNANSFTAVLSRLMDTAAALEASMNSVERVVHFTDNAPQDGGGFFVADGERGGADGEPHAEVDDGPHDGRHASPSQWRRAGALHGTTEEEEATRGLLRGAAHNGEDDDDDDAGMEEGSAGRGGRIRSAAERGEVAPAHASYDATGRSPAVGALELHHVYLRYRPGLPFVLQDLSFRVRPGERVGVVGRTGSGKSSLMLVLMRLIDITAGSIVVNGRDIGTFESVAALRRLFAIIPQDPVLFDGTIRANLDPLQDSTDAEVWAALRHVGMAECCEGEPQSAIGGDGDGDGGGRRQSAGLRTPVVEGGKNFSVGQRQLLCLARALLRRESCFLLMDEATASVDGAMDQQIQAVVQQQFPRHTILSIAHRLHTVAQFDRILMLDGGRVVCFGTPQELMAGVGDARTRPASGGGEQGEAKPLSPFAQLVMSMGPESVRLFIERMQQVKARPAPQ